MPCFLFKFTLVLNSALFIWKFLVFDFLHRIAEILLCSLSEDNEVVCGDVDAFGTKTIFLIIFYSGSFFLLKYELYSV
jgi:hypothetical protein